MNHILEEAKHYFLHGLDLFKQKDFVGAEKSFLKALLLTPDRPSILINLSATLIQLGKWHECEEICQQILNLEPNNCEALLNLSVCLSHNNDQAMALMHLDKAIANNSNLDSAWVNKGNIFYESGDLIQANNCFEKALSINPLSQEALVGRGNLKNEKKEYQLAIKDFNAALDLNPSNSQAKWNKALSLIRLGDFEEGWKLYESRWEIPGMREHRSDFGTPLWLGEESPKDKTILIHSEQGYGDTIQFSRYIPLLQDLGAKVIFAVPEPLIELMKTISQDIEIVSSEDAKKKEMTSRIDLQCPIMSLALAFNTSIETIPNKIPYLNATSEKCQFWRKRISKTSTIISEDIKPFRVGISWSGSGHYAGKSNLKRNISTSEMAQFINSFPNQKVEFHSLQIEKDKNDSLRNLTSNNLKAHEQHIQNFSDTAALMMAMDLIISVDTANAHLAGALNKPTLLFIPDPPDFMALTNTSKSPWYPKTTMLRQKIQGNWNEPLTNAIAMVNALINNQSALK